MKRYDEEEVKLIAMRIKSARALTGLSQVEFCGRYSLSLGALKTWESGKFSPRMANLQELCRCFNNEGIVNVTTSWFLNGEGPAPTHIKGNNKSELEIFTRDDPQGLFEEIELFKKNQLQQNRKPIVTIISDGLMSPYFSDGDIVGGIEINDKPLLTDMNNRPFLVEIKPKQYVVRWCFFDGDSIFLRTHKDALICQLNNRRFGRILWHRRF